MWSGLTKNHIIHFSWKTSLVSYYKASIFFCFFKLLRLWDLSSMCARAKSIQSFPISDPMDYRPPGSSVHGMHFPGKNTGIGCHDLLRAIFLTQESNQRLLHLLHWQADSLPLATPGDPSWTPCSGSRGFLNTRPPGQSHQASIFTMKF